MNSTQLLSQPDLIKEMTQRSLVLFTWGRDNNDVHQHTAAEGLGRGSRHLRLVSLCTQYAMRSISPVSIAP